MLAVVACGGDGPTPQLPPGAAQAPATPPPFVGAGAQAGYLSGTVLEVVDGDTLDVQLQGGAKERVRLLAVDALETGRRNTGGEYPGVTDAACLDDWGLRASQFVSSRLAGRTVVLEEDPQEGTRDAFGRLLAYIVVDGVDLNAALVQEGYARVYTEGKAQREAQYLAYQASAREQRKGLWSCAPPRGQASPGIVIADLDLAGESVTIVNQGSVEADLTGWTLRSTVGEQEFTFPSLVLGPGERVQVVSGDAAEDNPPRTLRWGERNVWNNQGDEAVLLDAQGREITRLEQK